MPLLSVMTIDSVPFTFGSAMPTVANGLMDASSVVAWLATVPEITEGCAGTASEATPGMEARPAELVSVMLNVVVPYWPAAGVNTSASRFLVTVLAVPVRVMAPLLLVLPSLAAFGSVKLPELVLFGVIVTLSVGAAPGMGPIWPKVVVGADGGLTSVMLTPANGVAGAAPVIVCG